MAGKALIRLYSLFLFVLLVHIGDQVNAAAIANGGSSSGNPKDHLSLSSCQYLINNGYYYRTNDIVRKLCAASIEPKCKAKALGMESGAIPDANITASRILESFYRPEQGRLHYRGSGEFVHAAWAPLKKQLGEWIQIDLGKEGTVTGVLTQSSGKPTLEEWVTKYSLQFSHDGENFEDYENGKVFNGNRNKNSVVENAIDPSIQARFIRLLPVEWYNWPSLRMELKGILKDTDDKSIGSLRSVGKADAHQGYLGMQSGAIPDSSITASSFYHSEYHPREARLNNRYASLAKPGAWMTDRAGEWIQVEFGITTIVTGIATQGMPCESVYTESYILKYSDDSKVFINYLNGRVFDGNYNNNAVVKHDLVPPINARYVRIYPRTWHNNGALRFELYGCKSATKSEIKRNLRAPNMCPPKPTPAPKPRCKQQDAYGGAPPGFWVG